MNHRVMARNQAYAAEATLAEQDVLPGYYKHTVTICIAMITVLVVRMHELFYFLQLIRPALLVSVCGFALIYFKTARVTMQRALKHPLTHLVFAYYLWGVATVPTSLWKAQAVEALRTLLPVMLMFTAIQFCPPRARTVNRIVVWWVIALTVFAVIGRMSAFAWRGRMSFSIGMYDSNDLAAVLSMGFPLALGVALRVKGWHRGIAMFGAALLLFTAIATGSRGGFLSLAAGALAYALFTRGPRQVIAVGLIGFGGFVGWTTASQNFRNRIIGLTNLEYDYNTTSDVGRKAVWRRGWSYIQSNPVFGVGIGNFPIAEGNQFLAVDRTAKWSTAHNAYIQATAEMGFVGGLIFVAMLLVGFRIGFKFSRGVSTAGGIVRMPEFIAALAAFTTSAMFLSHAYFTALFALLAVMALADRAYSPENQELAPSRSFSGEPVWTRRIGERGGLAWRRSGLRDARAS